MRWLMICLHEIAVLLSEGLLFVFGGRHAPPPTAVGSNRHRFTI